MSYNSYDGAGVFTHKQVDEDFSSAALAGFTEKHMQYAVYKCAHTVKLFLRVVLIFMIIWMVWAWATYILDSVFGIKMAHRCKEGLQYLGASTDVTLDQREVYKNSLTEQKAIAAQSATTAGWDGTPAAPPKPESFTEKMTPEEKELASIKKTLK